MVQLAGIDLGTTFSALATLDELGKPRVQPNYEGEALTPSVIFFDRDSVLIGTEAVNALGMAPQRGVSQIKHHMGDPDHSISIDGKDWTPQELSALILKKLRTECCKGSAEELETVITVPASFEEPHRAATQHAGEIAGLSVRALINEPTAAALYYATTQDIEGTVLVYDLGGGTFDATVMKVNGTEIEILSSDGNRRLGGVDFDRLLVDRIADMYESEKGRKLIESDEDDARVEQLANRMKRTLSRRDRAREVVGLIEPAPIEISRSDFEQLISAKIAITEMLVDSALDQAGLKASQVDRILLVGGSTRIPLVSKRLETIFGKPPLNDVNVDQAVAMGAAIQAGLVISGSTPSRVPVSVRQELERVAVSDVAPADFGTIVLTIDPDTGAGSDENVVILEKNSPLGKEWTKSFYTIYDNQEAVDIQVTQGNDPDPEYVGRLGSYAFRLPAGRPKGQEIRVTYSYDLSGRIRVQALDVESGRREEFEANADNVMRPEQVASKRASLDNFIVE